MRNTFKLAIFTLILTLSANIAFAQTPTTAEGYYTLGRQQLNQKNFDGAVKSFTECLKLNAKAGLCEYARGMAYFQLKKFDESIADFTSLLKTPNLDAPARIQTLNGRIMASCYSGKIEDATRDENAIKALGGNVQKTCVQFLAENPSLRPKFEINKKPENVTPTADTKSAEDWFKSGNEQYAQKKYFDAIGSFTGCIKTNPSFSGCYANRGLAYFNIGNFEKAIADLSVGIKAFPDKPDLYKLRYMSNCEMGKFNDAVKADADQVKKLGGSVGTSCGEALKASLAENRGDIARSLGDYYSAIQSYNEALNWRKIYSSTPRFSAFFKRRDAYCLIGGGELAVRDDEAMTRLGWKISEPCAAKSALITTENDFINRGKHFYEKGLYDEAGYYFEKALKINPNSKEANFGKGKSSLKGSSDPMISPEYEAIEFLEKAIKIDPRYIPAYQVRAEAYCSLSKDSFSDEKSKQANLASAKADEQKVIELGGKIDNPCK